MGYSNRVIEREVFRIVPETCPKVDGALEEAAEAIKEQTGLLRHALREYVERALNAEDDLSEAQEIIKQLKNEIEEIKHQLAKVDY